MKKVYTYLREISLIIALLVLATGAGWGQEYDSETGKEIVEPDIPRTALVGPDCLINTMIDVVNVLGGTDSLNNLVDNNLNNSAQIGALADVGVIEEPAIVRIKDRKHVYKEGTIAGFCVESSEEGLLQLNVINIVHIGFYKNDVLIETKCVDTGDNLATEDDDWSAEGGGLLDLGLIPIGSDEAVLFLQVEAPCDFDEIALMVGGVSVDLFRNTRIRYGYVGAAKQTKLISESNIDGFCANIDNIGFVNGDNIIGDPSSFATQLSILGLYVAEADAILKWTNPFPAGSEVGFHIQQLVVLDTGLSGKDYIRLFKTDGSYEDFDLSRNVIDIKLLQFVERNVSIIAPFDFVGAQLHLSRGILDVGLTNVYYGFVNEPTDIPNDKCHIEGLSMDASVCGNETTFQLNPVKDVTWNLTKVTTTKDGDEKVEEAMQGVQIDNNGLVTGIQYEGYYHFHAVQTKEDGTQCEGEVILQHGITSTTDCNTPATESIGYELAGPRGISGGIGILNNVKNLENVVNDNYDDYAEINPGAQLLHNNYIVGVRKEDDSSISDGNSEKRIGFLVDLPSTFLNVDALEFFHIYLYDENGDKIEDYPVENWDVISAGLIGNEKNSKVRLGVTVPSGVKFYEYALWSGGIASIQLSSMRIYTPFVEDADSDCDNPLHCDDAVIVGNGALSDAYINYERTSLPAIGIGVGMTGLENLLSGTINPDKCFRFAAFAELDLSKDGSTSVAVNFGRVLSPKQQAGFVVKQETFLANVDLLGSIVIETYLDGNLQDSKSDFSLLDANVIGAGDYEYLMFYHDKSYDEIRIIFPSLLDVLDNMEIYALFVRNDSDGDGIADCIDPNPCSDELTGLNLSPTDICEDNNEKVILTGSANFSTLPKTYSITINNGTTETIVDDLKITQNGVFTYELTNLSRGEYSLTLKEKDNTEATAPSYTLYFTVHPKQSTWKPSTKTDIDREDWNEWTNWTEGSPWTCTDVIIPSDADTYPVLESGVMNGCRYIHFEPNAEVVNTHRLTYEKAWVELALHPNRYYMVTVPLKDTYSGDWFIPQTEPEQNMKVQYPDTFSVLDAQFLPENRVTPTVYQRVWAFKTYNKFFDAQGNAQEETLAATTHWSAPYNYLATPYDKNEGGYDYNAVSVWVHPLRPDATEEDNLDGLTYTFRFPKEHTLYQYYDEHGTSVNAFESIKREQPGRFIYESKDSTFSFPDTMRFYANSETEDGKKLFLVGNPFMSFP